MAYSSVESSNIIDHRKVYVEVTLKISPEGEVRPLTITFEDGIVYEIDRLKHRCRAHATKVSGTGIRYTIYLKMMTDGLLKPKGYRGDKDCKAI